MAVDQHKRAHHTIERSGGRFNGCLGTRDRGFWILMFVILSMTTACNDVEQSMTRGLGGGVPAKSTAPASTDNGPKVEETATKQVYSDDNFVESDFNRDPFRSFTALFKSAAVEEPQRTVIMPTTAIENMKLIAIISGIPSPKAMLVDGQGVGHTVERGMYLGRPEIVRASENVSMTLNWRVHRIRENEVVLTRADPTDPNRPPLTRVIPLRENDLVANR